MAVREGLLALLIPGERYGYQLKTEFESATGGVWSLNVGQVYTTLDRLHRDGLVDFAESDGQKLYHITAAGRQELGNWWHALPSDDPPPRDELMLKVLMAIERDRSHGLTVITEQRTAIHRLLQLQRRRRNDDGHSSVAASLVHDSIVVRAEADLRWLDICEAKLLSESAPAGRVAHPLPGG